MSDLVERLRVLQDHYSTSGQLGSENREIFGESADEIEHLEAHLERHHRAEIYWEGRWRDEAAENEKLRKQLATARKAISDIKQATIDGKVCDDVAWFDTITTLHDFCDLALAALTDEEGNPK
jgi:capsule polysaccharide export protein KpsE/RkpR